MDLSYGCLVYDNELHLIVVVISSLCKSMKNIAYCEIYQMFNFSKYLNISKYIVYNSNHP